MKVSLGCRTLQCLGSVGFLVKLSRGCQEAIGRTTFPIPLSEACNEESAHSGAEERHRSRKLCPKPSIPRPQGLGFGV